MRFIPAGAGNAQTPTIRRERWSLVLGIDIRSEQAILCLIDLELARLAHPPKHLDSIVDIAGYAACLHEVNQ
jgi:Domain of unknown function (DUF6378)